VGNRGKRAPREVDQGVFVGTYRRKVDDKWRLPLPSDLLAGAGEGDQTNFYFAPSAGHLILFSEQYFDQLATQVHAKSVMAHRELRKKFFGNTYKKPRDKSGRITIPESLRGRCGFDAGDEVVLVGTGPYVEILPVSMAPQEPRPEEMDDIFDSLGAIGEG
jgi:DNA-binding transcriptional regulator/RsmH inhibitor MraZ